MFNTSCTAGAPVCKIKVPLLVTRALDPQAYWQFAARQLSDLAERRTQSGKRPSRGQRRVEVVNGGKQRIRLLGDHICYAGQERYRGSDLGFRLDQAIRALERYYQATTGKKWGAIWNAGLMAADLILRSGHPALRQKLQQNPKTPVEAPKVKKQQKRAPAGHRPFIMEERVARFDELDHEIARQQLRPTSKYSAEVHRLAKKILKKVDQFRKQHTDLDLERLFAGWLGGYRAEYWPDADWYTEQERVYADRIEATETHLDLAESGSAEPPRGLTAETWESVTANKMCTTKQDLAASVVCLAALYHRQQKYFEAKPQYERALALYEASSSSGRLLKIVIPWIRAQIANCQAHKILDGFPSLYCRPGQP
jgi:hypothetical protein